MAGRRSWRNKSKAKKPKFFPLKINSKILERVDDPVVKAPMAQSDAKRHKAQQATRKRGEPTVTNQSQVGDATVKSCGKGKKRPRDEDDEGPPSANNMGQFSKGFPSNKRARLGECARKAQPELLPAPVNTSNAINVSHNEQSELYKERQQIFNQYVKDDTAKPTQPNTESLPLPASAPSSKDVDKAGQTVSVNHVPTPSSTERVTESANHTSKRFKKHDCALAGLCRASYPMPRNTQDPTKLGLASLPHELLIPIFKYTDSISAVMLALTCRKLAAASTLANVGNPRDSKNEKLELLLLLRDSMRDDLRLCCKCRKYLPINGRRYQVDDYIWDVKKHNEARDRAATDANAPRPVHFRTERGRIRAALTRQRMKKGKQEEPPPPKEKAKYSRWKDEDWVLLKIGGARLRKMNQDKGIEYRRGEENGEIRSWCPKCAFDKGFTNIVF